jgi:hypothetical protein
MKHTNAPRQAVSGKPYDIRERTELFACEVVSIGQELHCDRDFRAKDRIALRELKEARLRLRILRRTGYLRERDDAVIQEAGELVKIVATIIRNSEAAAARRTGKESKS